jgi:hypothetical protein
VKALLLAAFGACGTDPATVTLVVPGTPAYFKGQVAGGPWQTFAGTWDSVNTMYTLAIDGDFELVMVCDSADSFQAAELFGTADDATVSIGSWNLPTCAPTPDAAPTTRITGMVDQAGFVAMVDATTVVSDPSMPYSLEVPTGLRDLAFTNFNFGIAIIHDLSIAGPTDEGTFSFTRAAPMLTNDYEVSLVADEITQAQTQVVTRNGTTLTFNFSPKMAVFVPPEQLSYGDTQTFSFFAVSADGDQRTATASGFADVPPQFDLLAPLPPFTWNPRDRALTWTPITDFYTSASAAFVDNNTSAIQTATASKLWLEGHATRTIAFDETNPPGYRASWHTLAPQASAIAELWSPGLILRSSSQQTFQTVR